MSGEIAPPSTMMPSGAPRVASQRGKRCSSGMISALPAGERPRIASTMRLAKANARPGGAKRVGSSNRPRMPIETTRLDGMAKNPRILERGKNIHQSLLLPRLVARLGVRVHGIEAGKLRPALDLADDEALHTLVLGALLGDEVEEVLRYHHRPVIVGAAVPAHQTGSLEASTPALSRTTPSVTSAATLRFIMRMVRMSPKMPAEVMPIASATATQPSGISSMAPRVEIGFAQLSGVARSSRTGTKRNVKAGPTKRAPPGTSGRGPFIQQRRMPFFNRIVVMVAVVIARSAS